MAKEIQVKIPTRVLARMLETTPKTVCLYVNECRMPSQEELAAEAALVVEAYLKGRLTALEKCSSR